jgi:NCK-associated protein 1
LNKGGFPQVEDYTDIVEMRTLSELLGAYGVRHFSRKLVQRVLSEVEELKKVVLVNKEILASVVDNSLSYDVLDVLRRIKNFDELISRTISVGMFLTFRKMINIGLRDVLPKRVPYLMNVLDDFKENNTRNESTLTHEMAQAAGIDSEFDAELYHALRNSREKNEGEGILWEYLLAFWGLSLSALAIKDTTEYNAVYEANENNAHLYSIVLNMLPQALFTITGDNVDDKLRMFLKVATTGLLRLGLDQGPSAGKETLPKQLASAYIVLDLIVKESYYLSQDELDMFFPYSLVRDAYNQMYKKHRIHTVPKRGGEPQPPEAEVTG